MTSRELYRAYAFGISALILAFAFSLKFGAVADADIDLIMQLRLPRIILAIAIGAGLAVAGAVLQAIFANPLCEPYTLGISSGSALGAVMGASWGLQWSVAGMTLTSFLGAILFTGILYLISLRRDSGNFEILLSGVMLGFLGSSLVALWMAISDIRGIQGALFWLLGDLSRARIQGAVFCLLSVLFMVFVVWTRWRELDGLLMGEETARTLGIKVDSARRRLIFLTAFLIAVCVSSAGMIGFVGLVVPHFARQMVGSLHFRLIPLCAIWGATALTVSDVIARVLASPYELPVGVVTALIGAPLFLWIMFLRRKREAV